jgi:hypothetical protein
VCRTPRYFAQHELPRGIGRRGGGGRWAPPVVEVFVAGRICSAPGLSELPGRGRFGRRKERLEDTGRLMEAMDETV